MKSEILQKSPWRTVVRLTPVALFVAIFVHLNGGLDVVSGLSLALGLGWLVFASIWFKVLRSYDTRHRPESTEPPMVRKILSGILFGLATYAYTTQIIFDDGFMAREDWMSILGLICVSAVFGIIPLLYDMFAHGLLGLFSYAFGASVLVHVVTGVEVVPSEGFVAMYNNMMVFLFPAEITSKLLKRLHARALEEARLL